MTPLPHDRPVFSFYGDDFTGSTDALEALASNGVPAVLFFEPPNEQALREFGDCRAVGIAGDSRSRTGEWMRAELPKVFARLRELGAPVTQYKVCSTFDSSPETGSIGCAVEIGREVFGSQYVPVVPAAPLLQRYVTFGNLFASGSGEIHRIDRHPTMQRHPVTPMHESDLRIHLACQTTQTIQLVNILDLRSEGLEFAPHGDVVLFDGLEAGDLERTAEIIWKDRRETQTFVVGSSGFTHGLLRYWRSLGLAEEARETRRARPVDRLIALAGSCSRLTERQICRALRDGFHGIRIDPRGAGWAKHDEFVEGEALERLSTGRSVVFYSALGVRDFIENIDRGELASAMGRILRRVAERSGVQRLVVAGGDTSSFAVRELGISALTFAGTLAPGVPLCRAHGAPHAFEIALKGGQMGAETFFEDALL
jgi:uncharacterized protein YgbK (DUF1537 family)